MPVQAMVGIASIFIVFGVVPMAAVAFCWRK